VNNEVVEIADGIEESLVLIAVAHHDRPLVVTVDWGVNLPVVQIDSNA
jgi:hypothetical protein